MPLNSAVNDRSLLHNHRWIVGHDQLCTVFNSVGTFTYGDKLKFAPALSLSQPLQLILFNHDVLPTLPPR